MMTRIFVDDGAIARPPPPQPTALTATANATTISSATGDSWLWLRATRVPAVVVAEKKEDRRPNELLNVCVGPMSTLSRSHWRRLPPIVVDSTRDPVIELQLWGSTDRQGLMMQFLGSCRATTTTSIVTEDTHGGGLRWYSLSTRRQRTLAWGDEHSPRIDADADAYSTTPPPSTTAAALAICLRIEAERARVPLDERPSAPSVIDSAKSPSGFRFCLPHRPLRHKRQLRDLRVGEILHERRVRLLEGCLSDVLHGACHATEPLTRALVLLQLACQYSHHCVSVLDKSTGRLADRLDVLNDQITRQRRRAKELDRRRESLLREQEVLDCSIDGMRAVLSEVDPRLLEAIEGPPADAVESS